MIKAVQAMKFTCCGWMYHGCALTHCTLLQSKYNLKAIQMNMQRSLIQELILYEFKVGDNTVEATKTFVVQKVKM